MTEESVLPPVPVPLKRNVDTSQQELPQAVVSPQPSLPRQTRPPSPVEAVACECAPPKKLPMNPLPPYPPDAYARRQQGRVMLEECPESSPRAGIRISRR